jgi:hypothetical protein
MATAPDRLPRLLLGLEGAAVAVAALVLYADGDHSWWLFAALVLAPDLSMLGYLAGPRVGALTYDLVHTELWPVALGAAGVLAGSEPAVAVALVWLVHIGVDRAVGYGLKYASGFKDTHLQRV